MTSDDYAFFEASFGCWDALTENQKKNLESRLAKHIYSKGKKVHNGSEDCTGLFIVKSGLLRVYSLNETGKEITLFRLLDRDICLFSASCIMKNINFDVYVEAEKDTEVIFIPRDIYQELMETSLAVSDYTNQLLSSRFSDVMWMMEQILFSSFDKRLASFLYEQYSMEDTKRLHITHEEIAKHMGSAREVVSRMLKYFQTEGIVSLSRGEIQITDLKKLKTMLN